jgi:hypothetical protein
MKKAVKDSGGWDSGSGGGMSERDKRQRTRRDASVLRDGFPRSVR